VPGLRIERFCSLRVNSFASQIRNSKLAQKTPLLLRETEFRVNTVVQSGAIFGAATATFWRRPLPLTSPFLRIMVCDMWAGWGVWEQFRRLRTLPSFGPKHIIPGKE
jgi:hypothetical protein